MGRANTYDQNYRRKCFDAWYLAGRPNAPAKIKEVIPANEYGNKPSTAQLNRWIIEGMWDAWADDLDARADQQLDENLINKKAEMLRQHQEDAKLIAQEAKNFLLSKDAGGFDSSASAVQAYFKATEEERKTAGFSDLLEKLDKLSNNDVERMIIEKFNRIKENDQIIDQELEDIPQLEDDNE